MAADSAVMVIDASKGVEAQTRKLFKVCAMRHIPVFTFINKLDRDANDTFELLDDIENELGIPTCPVNWPIGSGKHFKGVYDRETKKVLIFSDTQKGTKEGHIEEISLEDPRLDEILEPGQREQLEEEIELLDGASAEFDPVSYTHLHDRAYLYLCLHRCGRDSRFCYGYADDGTAVRGAASGRNRSCNRN